MINSTAVREIRADEEMRKVICPGCQKTHRVHYFSYTGITCHSCTKNIDTYTWKAKIKKK